MNLALNNHPRHQIKARTRCQARKILPLSETYIGINII